MMYVVVIGFMAHYNHSVMPPKIKYENETATVFKNQYGIWYLFLFAGFIFVTIFRYNVGADFWYYYIMDIEWDYVKEMFIEMDEPLSLILHVLGREIWDIRAMNIFMLGIVTQLLVFYGISQYDENDITLNLLLYILIGGWLFSLNGMRQALAVSFIFAFSKKSDGKFWILKYVVVVLIAYLIHKSALVLLPILIISQLKINKYQIGVIAVCAFVIPMFFDWVYVFMDVDVTNEYSLGYIQEAINPIRIVVAFAPLALLLLAVYKKEFVEKNFFITNMAIFHALLTLTTANSAYLNRITKFTTIFLIIFIPKVLKATTRNLRIVSTVLTVLLYMMFFFYEVNNTPSFKTFKWVFEKLSIG